MCLNLFFGTNSFIGQFNAIMNLIIFTQPVVSVGLTVASIYLIEQVYKAEPVYC